MMKLPNYPVFTPRQISQTNLRFHPLVSIQPLLIRLLDRLPYPSNNPSKMHSTKLRRKVAPANGVLDNSADKQDQLLLSAAICNGEDLGPFVRKAFASGKPETLLHNLRQFARSKESEIEEVCKAHYQDFILAVDDLRSLALRRRFIEIRPFRFQFQASVCRWSSVDGARLLYRGPNRLSQCELSSYLNHVMYQAHGALFQSQPSFIQRESEFGAVGDRSSLRARQREEDLRIKQRQAEEQSRLSLRDCVYALQEEDDDDGLNVGIGDDVKDGHSNGLREFAWSDFAQIWYPVDALLDVLSKHRDKYHELLLSDCRKQIAEALAADKFEQMLMKKEYEYSMNVLSFQIQTSDIIPAFPYVAPFSSTVPDCCRIVRSFIEDSVSFMSYGGQLDFFDVVKKYLDRLLSEVLDEALLKLINTSVHGVSQAMQVAANMAVMEHACDFFFRHAAQLSGIPLRMAERCRRQFPLNKARDAAEEMLSGLLKQKADGFMTLIENVNWMADEPIQSGNEYVNEVIIYLETLVSTAQQILPVRVLKRVLQDVLFHISETIVGTLFGDSVKRFNVNAIMGIDVDIRLLESFADNLASSFSEGDTNQLGAALAEIRQLINLLLSNHPENFLNPVIRERSYNTLDYRKVVTISEKLRDPSDRLFGTFGSRGARQNPKKKSLDALIKRLKDVS
ncbi:hypothetical protein GH714_023366 [Hevea brasiliensis]|uniref:Exocyst complex component n=1 Tax=Hevea brasiliensis TaxID=3981 RepID=A0A6A6LEG5_HEVBR|nr:hypothetical protein GH714_023366 [Hevea brasiliensis]